MSETNVSNAPLAIVVSYFSKVTEQQVTNEAVASLESSYPPLSVALAPLLPFIGQPLGSYFNNLWKGGLQAALQTLAAIQFTQNAAQKGYSVTNVKAVFPASGTVWAAPTPPGPPTAGSPGEPGSLTLSFQLPGCDISFDTGAATAEWDVSFDTELQLFTLVPRLPFSLSFSQNLLPSNANLSADNVVAWFEEGFASILNFLSFGLYSDPLSGIPSEFDSSSEQASVAAVTALATNLNNLGAEVVGVGFTACEFLITSGSTLTLSLTHPLDPGPVVENLDDPPPNPLSIPPSLIANAAEVKPGTQIVLGSWPAIQAPPPL
jgi:hypothetical protein